MPSKMVIDRQKRSLLIVAAAREHSAAIVGALRAELEALLGQGEKFPDIELFVKLLQRRLEAELAQMTMADEAHIVELGDDDEPRTRRDQSAAALAATIDDLTEIVRGLFGAALLAPLQLDVARPRDATTVSSWAGEIVTNLRKTKFPAPRVEGAKFNPESWAKRIEKEAGTVKVALEDVARETRQAETTLTSKNAAMASHDVHQGRVATLLSGLLEAAGLSELAGRVRPPLRRGRAGAAPEGEDEGGGGAGGGGP